MPNYDIYHITHVENLAEIVNGGGLFSESRLIADGRKPVVIGFDNIKARRLRKVIPCCAPLTVGQCVPFYFCSRSIMLYVIEKRPRELQYRGGQREIVHLVSDVDTVIADAKHRVWAFSDGNAATGYTSFYDDRTLLQQNIDWAAVRASDWRDPAIKDKKQAEFLVQDFVSWRTVKTIGVFDAEVGNRVHDIIGDVQRPNVVVSRRWYY